MPSCTRAAQMWCPCGVAPFVGALWKKGLMWCRTTHLAFMCLCGCFSSPDESMHLSDSYSCPLERKTKWQKPTFAWYVALCWWERLLPVKLSKLQIHCRSSAVSWPVHNYLKHFDPCCVLSIHQAATAVSDQLRKTPPLTVYYIRYARLCFPL